MAFTPKVLAEGQLPNTKTALYTVPGATSAYVHNVKIYNTNAAAQTVRFYVNASGTSRRLPLAVLAQDESADVIDQPLQLETGDAIEAETTTSAAVDYILTGVEQS